MQKEDEEGIRPCSMCSEDHCRWPGHGHGAAGERSQYQVVRPRPFLLANHVGDAETTWQCHHLGASSSQAEAMVFAVAAWTPYQRNVHAFSARSSTLSALLSPHRSEMSVSFSSPTESRADRVAKETKALKKRTHQIEWDARTDFLNGTWLRKSATTTSLRRLRAHAEAALHKRGLAILDAANDANWEGALAKDILYQVLSRQIAWLQAISAHVKKHGGTTSLRRRSADDAFARRSDDVKAAFQDDTYLTAHVSSLPLLLQATTIPCHDDPSNFDFAFEMVLVASQFYKTDIGQRLERTAISAFKDISTYVVPRATFAALHHDICAHLAAEHGVSAVDQTLRRLVRRLLCGRLAAAYYAPVVTTLARDQRQFDASVESVRQLSLTDVGLIDVGVPHDEISLSRTIDAIEELPVLLPDGMLQTLMAAIATLHDEVGDALGVTSSLCLSADIVLPILVSILSHAQLPLLYMQLHAMEAMGLSDASVGGETSYYVALLQAAAAAVIQHASS
ncbi:hypothetical protein SDRG_07877 [Saprolegnia diclina VS20]|uniref:VPS9 domain-containing protein n=1 Tax=Saprolegnia diclina (strain VS20) TaxID=1156394 RepID=T0QL76_SAPDV|nr:hypothetical protein SDRG_07877 [Saprolegnia diclina VS20]EQC34550.1 hypothetical protein SDRG_07877 [Saprolegnia diclina VS20]|eukprot:XP_008611956.1 hypothetical protein SDRG_07877 [Saprolegnia diclina VS20]